MTKAATDQTLSKCACGCGEEVRNLFVQGHDQKLIAKLALDVVEGTGTGMGILESGDEDIQERITKVGNYVSAKLSPALAAKFDSAAHNRWASYEKRTTRAAAKASKQQTAPGHKNRTVKELMATASDQDGRMVKMIKELSTDEPAPVEETGPEQVGLGAQVRIRVGRYEYDAEVIGMSQAGKVTSVRYTNKAQREHVISAPKAINLVAV